MKQRMSALMTLLLAANGLIWLVIFFASRAQPVLLGLAAVAYGLGLRHAVDADHIAAIDNTTRTLIAKGQRPIGIGFFFSLGHSAVVIGLSGLVAVSVSFVQEHMAQWVSIGAAIGAWVSIVFLLLLGAINLLVLIQTWRRRRTQTADAGAPLGIMSRILRPLLRMVNTSWHMVFVGLLFGLGFDTASEVALLSMAAATTGAGTMPVWNIMLLPLAFGVGMVLIDSLNGMFMLDAYQWAYLDSGRKFYYNITITFVSVATALGIAAIEIARLLGWHLDRLNMNWLGYGMILVFILSWAIAWVLYKFWINKKF